MIKALVSVRFRALFAGMTAQAKKQKKKSTGLIVLYVVLYLYLLGVIGGVMCLTFHSLSQAYHAAGLDWLYFAMAGLMALGLSVIGSVFTTQSQLYDAKDNTMLLSMPIPSKIILLSRMLPLLALNLLFGGIVMIPAIVMYAIFVQFSIVGILLQLTALLVICILAQSIACLLGWLLHLLLSKMNKSLASILYLVVFLAVYFSVYTKAGDILQAVASSGDQIAEVLQTWVWPLYAMGVGCLGDPLSLLIFAVIAAALFALVYWILSVTFLRTATSTRSSRKRRKLDMQRTKAVSPTQAIVRKELRKFLGCPVYLTNMGLGILLTAALPIAALCFRSTVLELLSILDPTSALTPLLICTVLSFSVSTTCISTPSVSLEGKNIWILKSMPLSGKQILSGKLLLHILLAVPVTMLAGLILAAAFGCNLLGCLLSALIPGLLALLNGLLGMWAGLHWAKLDYISEAYPCKQSVSVLVAMFGMMGIPLVLGICYAFLSVFISANLFLILCAFALAAVCCGLFRVIMTWGVQKWDSL